MNRTIILAIACIGFLTNVLAQNQEAVIKIEKSENGETVVIEKNIELEDGQDLNSVLEELGVLDELGNLKEGQSFEINVIKKSGPDTDQDIKIEYFDTPDFDFKLESKAFLGVMLAENHDGEGVRIEEVIENTQAAKSNLQAGDIILSMNGAAYDNVGELVEAIAALNPGDQVSIVYSRNGMVDTEVIELGEKAISPFEMRPFSPEDFSNDWREMNPDSKVYEFHFDDENGWSNGGEVTEQAFLGVSPGYECTEEKQAGVLIGSITPNSAAEEMGMQSGDRIVKVNKQEVNSFEELAELIQGMEVDEEIKVEVTRDGKKERLQGTLGAREVSSNSFPGFDMFEGFGDFPQQREFFFKFDGSEEDIQLEGIEEQLEEMLRNFEGNIDFNAEEFERDLEDMLTPYIENFDVETSEVNILISIEQITAEDVAAVNQNAAEKIAVDNSLDLDYVSFFPNPTTGRMNLSFRVPEDDEEVSIRVYNQTGKTVFEEVVNGTAEYENQIDLSDLASGPYYLQIVQGSKSYAKKIVKE